MAQRAERDEHPEGTPTMLATGDSPLVADRIEDADRKRAYGSRRLAGGREGHGRARFAPVADGVRRERFVCPDELLARRGRASVPGVGDSQRMSSSMAPSTSTVGRGAGCSGSTTPGPIGQLADDTEVDIADDVVREDEEVGRVEVGMERPEHVDLVEHVPVEVTDDPVRSCPSASSSVEVRLVAVRTAITMSMSGMPSISSVVSTREVV